MWRMSDPIDIDAGLCLTALAPGIAHLYTKNNGYGLSLAIFTLSTDGIAKVNST